MLVNLSFKFVPRPLTTVMIAIEMPAAISPYSMAVAPDWSFRKRAKSLLIKIPQLGRLKHDTRAIAAQLNQLLKSHGRPDEVASTRASSPSRLGYNLAL